MRKELRLHSHSNSHDYFRPPPLPPTPPPPFAGRRVFAAAIIQFARHVADHAFRHAAPAAPPALPPPPPPRLRLMPRALYRRDAPSKNIRDAAEDVDTSTPEMLDFQLPAYFASDTPLMSQPAALLWRRFHR